MTDDTQTPPVPKKAASKRSRKPRSETAVDAVPREAARTPDAGGAAPARKRSSARRRGKPAAANEAKPATTGDSASREATTPTNEPPASAEPGRRPAEAATAAAGTDAAPAAPAGADAGERSASVPAAPVQPAATAESAAAAPAARKRLLRTTLDVRWGDMDAFNHVNNAVFLSYLEEARLRWLQGLDGPWLDDNTAPLLAAAHVDYRRPIEWPNRIAIELFADRIGTSSLTLGHRITAANDAGIVYSEGHVVLVWIDRRHGRGSRLPKAVRTACG